MGRTVDEEWEDKWDQWLAEFQVFFKREDLLMRHQPKCPRCGTDQVQIMGRDVPASWRCRRCKLRFTSEPDKTMVQ